MELKKLILTISSMFTKNCIANESIEFNYLKKCVYKYYS